MLRGRRPNAWPLSWPPQRSTSRYCVASWRLPPSGAVASYCREMEDEDMADFADMSELDLLADLPDILGSSDEETPSEEEMDLGVDPESHSAEDGAENSAGEEEEGGERGSGEEGGAAVDVPPAHSAASSGSDSARSRRHPVVSPAAGLRSSTTDTRPTVSRRAASGVDISEGIPPSPASSQPRAQAAAGIAGISATTATEEPQPEPQRESSECGEALRGGDVVGGAMDQRAGVEEWERGPLSEGELLEGLEDMEEFEMDDTDEATMKIWRLFCEIDVDGSGTLEREEVSTLASTMGAELTEGELDVSMLEMDADGSGACNHCPTSVSPAPPRPTPVWPNPVVAQRHCGR